MTEPSAAETAIADYVTQSFGTFAELVRLQARARPDRTAIICEGESISYAELDTLADRVAAGLQRDGVGNGSVVGICAASSIAYLAIYIGTLRTGAAISPLSPYATPAQLAAMLEANGATHLFTDDEVTAALSGVVDAIGATRIALTPGTTGQAFKKWLPKQGTAPRTVTIKPEQAFAIMYSSGTTGTPKGIVTSHAMRWPQIGREYPPGYGPTGVAVISTQLFSGTTLPGLLNALAGGSLVVLMPRFDARRFLELSEKHRATHAVLVPVQYQRVLDVADFDDFDLSSYICKFVTSAPFSAELKAEVLRRWPGGLIEWYGMSEGGGVCELIAHEHPDKLHTVGRPIDHHEMFVIGEKGERLGPGEAGEVVGRSDAMMTGYHNNPDKTADREWFDENGVRFIRTGDIASIDEDGFFTLVGRRKDMIISGGFNIYPVDLEAALLEHDAVAEAAVIGVPSSEWGETPVAFVTLKSGISVKAEDLRRYANERLGKIQRITTVRTIDELPRSAMGKILKRELRLFW